MIKKIIFTWETISSIQKSKLVKAVAIWFLFLPILVKFIETESIQIYIPTGIELPFSWGFFYLSSTMFFLASILYFIKSPKIIQMYAGLDEYLEKNGSTQYLKTLFIDIIKDKNIVEKEGLILKFLGNDQVYFIQNSYENKANQCDFKDLFKGISHLDTKIKISKEIFDTDEHKNLYEKISKDIIIDWKAFILTKIVINSNHPSNEYLAEYFSYLKEIAATNNITIRVIISALYIIGFLALAYVAFENIGFVFNYYSKSFF